MTAIYPGSFDPVTNGHMDILVRASGMFDRLIVLVAQNSAKSPMFSAADRVEMLRLSCSEMSNVTVEVLPDTLTVEHAIVAGAKVIVKGLRAVSDFEYEFQMALLNRYLRAEVETVFLMTSAEYSYLSSSVVKEIARLGGDVRSFVPEPVLPYLNSRFSTVGLT